MQLKPLPFTLTPGRKALWKHLLGTGLITALGACSVYWQFSTLAGWGLLIIGGLLTPITIVQLLPGAASVALDPQGFHVTGLYRRVSYRWDEIEEFGVYYPTPKKPMVGFNFLPDSRPKSWLMQKSREKFGYEASLGDVYGESPEQFAEMMNAHLRQQTEGPVAW
jgi:hypothetical protein